MPDAIVYCDRCGKLIMPSQIREGRALNTELNSLCGDCLTKLPTDERAALQDLAGARAGRTTPGHRRTAKTHIGRAPSQRARRATPTTAGTDQPPPSSKLLLPVVGVASVLAGVAAVMLLMPSRSAPDEPKPVVSTAVPAGAAHAPPSPAQQRLAEIEQLRTPDMAKYAEMRTLLAKFPEEFPDTPEAGKAKELLFTIDTDRARLAEDALAAARTEALKHATAGNFDEAQKSIGSMETRFADGPWMESKGEAAIAEVRSAVVELRREWRSKHAAETLEKARAEFEAGRYEQAGELIAAREKWPAAVQKKADELAAEIERKLAEVVAERKRAEERAKLFAEFDRLMIAGDFAAAAKFADAHAEAEGGTGKMFRAAARVAKALVDKRAARMRGAKTLVGVEARLKLVDASVVATVKTVSETGLDITTKFTINNQTRERPSTLAWDALHADQKAEFTKLGRWKVEESDAPIVSAYAALSSNELDAALKAVEAGEGHPLAKRLLLVVERKLRLRAYEEAMKRARECMAREEWKGAMRACKGALAKKPGDQDATDLLEEARIKAGLRYDENILVNGSGELYPFEEHGWKVQKGSWVQGTNGPKHGKAYFHANRSRAGYVLYQDVSVAPYADEIASGAVRFKFEAYLKRYREWVIRAAVECRSSDGKVLDRFASDNEKSDDWLLVSTTVVPPVGTTTVRVLLTGNTGHRGSSGHSYYDDIKLIPFKPGGAGSKK
jgi:hypothetical protein